MNATASSVVRLTARRIVAKPAVETSSFQRIVLINEMSRKMQEKATAVAQSNIAKSMSFNDNTSFKRMVLINEMGRNMEQKAKQVPSRTLTSSFAQTQQTVAKAERTSA